ncbi:hypothetical protein OK18_09055 [Chryseobacterium gallinarum]|uniref:Uncharacterized protein n=1 Tax=Chryseobacterium gallinarum TaxID=1324352 RepID=A0A0G3M6R2_CHRGL|nr:hypothetical protein OK18_09055 [Chryseobacterium gallinarum]
MQQPRKQSIQQNRIGLNKLTIEIIASAFVLISAILPFLNNIVGYFIDVNVQLDNNAGERRLDLDSSIYFLSISSCFILLALGGLFKANRYTFYVALVAGYFHLVTYIKFIFFNQNKISAIADMAIILLLILIIFLVFRLDNYYRKLHLLDKFNNSTLDRFSNILFKRNDIKENE